MAIVPDPGWDRMQRLFERAVELPPTERADFLDAECAGESDLRERLTTLLSAHDALHLRDGPAPNFLVTLDAERAGAILDDVEPEDGPPGDREPDPERIGRYDVIRRIGRGGTGIVYLARDPELDRPVAIKLLAGSDADREGGRRLRAEARAASALDHPNIGTVYEIGESGERPYIAMAYYEGETVRERIETGPVPVPEAAALIAQLADGLEAAHSGGIVHRDIKPENLVVTSGGLVRILDFGIARVTAHTQTAGSGVRGTVAYMSPEQTQGRPVDGRTDIWAAGVVLYEMLTGTRPFHGETQDVVLYRIRHDDPAPVRAIRPEASPALSAIVARCLEKDPARRFGTARELANALRAATGLPTPAPLPAASVRPPALTRRRRYARAAAVVVALLATAAGAGFYLDSVMTEGLFVDRSDGRVVAAGEPIVLADFAADPTDAQTARLVTEALRIDLHQSPAFRVAEAGDVAAGLLRMRRDPGAGVPADAALELAVREGYKAVIAGDVGTLGGRYLVTARVLAASDGSTLAAFRETAEDSTGLIDAVDRLSKRVRERVGEPLRSVRQAEPLPRVATASLPALRLYAEAARLAWTGGDDARIAGLMERAVALDSTFAAAHRALATTYWNMRADRTRTVAATRAAYARRAQLPERDRYLIEAAHAWQVLGDPARAGQAYRRVLDVDPDHVAARTNLGLALLFEGRPAEAERVLRAGADSPPDALRLNLARALYFQGRAGQALALIDSIAATRTEGSPAAGILRVRLLGGEHRWAEAEAAARAVLQAHGQDPQTRAEATRSLWHLALVQGRLARADSLHREVENLLARIGALDALARARVRQAEARRILHSDAEGALELLHDLLDREDLDILTAGATLAPRVAAALAAAGDTARAAALVDAWIALPAENRGDPDTFSPELARARIDLRAEDLGSAIARLQQASAGTIQAINYLPDLAESYHRAASPDSARAAIERYLTFRHTRRLHRIPPHLGPLLIRLADLYEAAGDTARAVDAHARLTELWDAADPALQPHVDRAQRRIAELGGVDR